MISINLNTVIKVFNPSDYSKNVHIDAIFDTGSVITCLPEKEIETLGELNYSLVNARNADGTILKMKAYIVDIQLGDKKFSEVEIIPLARNYGLIGREILNSVKIVFDAPNLQCSIE